MEQRSNVFCHGGYKNQDSFIVFFFHIRRLYWPERDGSSCLTSNHSARMCLAVLAR